MNSSYPYRSSILIGSEPFFEWMTTWRLSFDLELTLFDLSATINIFSPVILNSYYYTDDPNWTQTRTRTWTRTNFGQTLVDKFWKELKSLQNLIPLFKNFKTSFKTWSLYLKILKNLKFKWLIFKNFIGPILKVNVSFIRKLLIFSNLKIKMGESFLEEPEIELSNQVTPRKNVSIVDSRWTKEPGLPWCWSFGPQRPNSVRASL